jgi:trehalose 6-phosphate phosphatase
MTRPEKERNGREYAPETASAVPPLLPEAALFLDFDGTLAPIADSPDAVVTAPYLPSLLLRVRSCLRGAVGVVSGRRIKDVDRLTGWTIQAVAGVHGLERRDANGKYAAAAVATDVLACARTQVRAFLRQHPRVSLEDKGGAIALHYRLCPDEADACIALATATVAHQAELDMVCGDHVVEIKTAGADKGTAVRAFLGEQPFSGRSPVFVGDDLTDENAFAEVLRFGGTAIIVGEREPTLAQYRLPGVHAVHSWLNAVG